MKAPVRTSQSLKETEVVAKEFVDILGPQDTNKKNMSGTVVFLEGDLGAGKTTFTKSVAKALGIKQTVISPTFILEKKYPIKNHKYYTKLIHIDAYRFDDPSESGILDLATSISDPHNLIFIEWASKLGSKIKPHHCIKFKSLNENTKQISW